MTISLRHGTSVRGWFLAVLFLLAAMPGVIPCANAQFTFVTNKGAITITGYTDTNGNLVIPAATNGYPVTGIATNAFVNNSYLTNVVIPAGVTYIGTNAFRNCLNITTATVPGAITNEVSAVSSPYVAVFYSDPITTITISLGSTYLITNAFFDFHLHDKALTNVIIPFGVTNIEETALGLIAGLTAITLPDSLISLGHGAFASDVGLTAIDIPQSVANIDFGAFDGCANLGNVTFEGGSVNIGPLAFYNCPSLTNVTFGAYAGGYWN